MASGGVNQRGKGKGKGESLMSWLIRQADPSTPIDEEYPEGKVPVHWRKTLQRVRNRKLRAARSRVGLDRCVVCCNNNMLRNLSA